MVFYCPYPIYNSMPALLIERPRRTSEGGTTATLVRGAPALLTHEGPRVVSVEIGGTEMRFARVQDGELIGTPMKVKTPSRYSDAKRLIRDASHVVLGGQRPDAAGVSIAGEVSRNGQTIESAGRLQEIG